MLNIGVAGHRRLDVEQRPRIEQALDSIAADICFALIGRKNTLREGQKKGDASSPSAHIKLISSLAEGADRIAFSASRFEQHQNIELQRAAILPFPRDVFCEDFDAANSVIDQQLGTTAEFQAIVKDLESQLLCNVITELQGDVEQRDHAYNACSRALVDASDLLIVIYDQRGYTNRGTAYTAHYAAERGIPLIHIPNRSGLTHVACNDEHGHRKVFEYTTLRLQTLLHNLRYGFIDE